MTRANAGSDPAATLALYRGVFEAMAEGIIVLTPEGRISLVNPAAASLLGQPREQLDGAPLRDLIWNCVREDGSPLLADDVDAILGQARDGCVLGLRGDNGFTWLTLNARPLAGADGVAGTLLSLTDISAHISSEAETRALSQRLALALNCAHIGAWEWDLATNLLHYDERIAAMYGFDLPNPTPVDTITPFVVDEDAAMVDRSMWRMIETRQGTRFEFRILRPGGETRYAQLAAEPVLAPSGEPLRVVGACVDVTEQRRNEAAVQTVRLQLRTLIDTLPAWVAMVDRDKRCLIANQRYADMFGLPVADIEGRDFMALVPAEFRVRHHALIDRCLAGEVVEATEDYLLPDHSAGFVQGRYVPVHQGGAVIGVVLAFIDVSELKRAQLRLASINADLLGKVEEIRALQARMHEMAIRDSLTGLHNRRYLDERLPRELARASRARSPLCVALGDLDHFKQLNDRYGHLAGDAVLREIAARFSGLLRESDLVCRWGGEELLIVMPEVAGEQALGRIESLRRALAEDAIFYGNERLPVTISFGIAEYPADGATADEIILAADNALYRAKADGRNCTRVHARFDPVHPAV